MDLLHRLQALGAGGRLDDLELLLQLQLVGEDFPEIGVVIDDQQGLGLGHGERGAFGFALWIRAYHARGVTATPWPYQT